MSGVSGLPGRLNQYKPLLDRYDLVSFDPRGVGATLPVRCGKTADDTGYEGQAPAPSTPGLSSRTSAPRTPRATST